MFRNNLLRDGALSGWLDMHRGDAQRGFCNVCRVYIRAHRAAIFEHRQTNRHRVAANNNIPPQR